MDDTKLLELKVGIFILIGLVILTIIVFSIGDIYFVKEGYHIKVRFSFANGVGGTAPVRLAGVGVGQIEGLRLFYDEQEKRTKVELNVWIRENATKIEKDARATINTLGLLGEKYLEIYPGKSPDAFLKNGDILVGHDPVPMEEITENLKNLASSANVVVERLKNGEGTIGKLLTDEAIYDNLEAFTADIKQHPWKLLSKPRGE